MARPQRRYHMVGTLFATAFAIVLAMPVSGQAQAASGEPEWQHASALTGTPKYGPDTVHFDYVNPDAPKGGLARLSTSGGFDTFNPILPKGNIAPGIGLVFESLMESSLDEVDISAMYGVLAEAVRYPKDFSWVEYRLNPNARWHDGQPVTVEDVIWSFEKVVEINPQQRFYYNDVQSAEAIGDTVVRFEFAATGNRELPHIMGQLTILPKHWWEGTGPDGNQRDISKGILEPPLGSGPYRIGDFTANRDITFERVPDYWGSQLPLRVGAYNFDEIRFVSFLDNAVEFEAFKGDQYDFRVEPSASQWAKAYGFPAIEDGRVVQEEFPDKASGIMQAFVPNLRRGKFSSPKLREALNYAYDFETTNEIVSANLLKRIGSYFAGTELASSGLPEGLELDILESVRDGVPPEVFTKEYKNPVGGNSGNVRNNLRQAVKLLGEAGYGLDGGKMVNRETGEQLAIEFIYYDKSFERSILPYTKNLNSIGIRTDLRLIDLPQYVNRVRNRDFDMATLAWRQSLSPGNEQRDFWGSVSADRAQSRNYAGIANPAVDTLIDRIIFAKNRDELVAATRALDRVLLWNHYVVPQFYADVDRTARWDRFSHPDNVPEYTHGFPTIWWFDEAKASEVGAKK